MMFGIRKSKPVTQAPTAAPEPESTNGVMCISIDSKTVIAIGNAQHQGKRDYQEDSFGFSETSGGHAEEKGILAVLADGMGGLTNGKAVSEMVVSGMLAWFNKSGTECKNGKDIESRLLAVNREICNIFSADGEVRSGSTAIAVLIRNRCMHWAAVGDSHIYLKRGGRLYKANEDHDFLNSLLDDVITEDISISDAFGDQQRNSLVSCIGQSDLSRADRSVTGFRLEKGDWIMLCSDGIYNALTEDMLSELMCVEPMSAAENIKQNVIKKGFPAQDNLTVVIIEICETGE